LISVILEEEENLI